jgi:hypothetical protein
VEKDIMAKYYQIRPSIQNPRPIVLDEAQREVLNFQLHISFIKGIKLDAVPPAPLNFLGELPDEMPPHFLIGNSIPVASALFLNVLKEAGVDNFETFPVSLYSKKLKKTWTDYYVINTIGVEDVADLEKSKYDTIMPGNDLVPPFLGFHEVIFSAEKLINDPKMFRIVQNKTMLFIHEFVRETFRRMVPPEKWGIVFTEIDVF